MAIQAESDNEWRPYCISQAEKAMRVTIAMSLGSEQLPKTTQPEGSELLEAWLAGLPRLSAARHRDQPARDGEGPGSVFVWGVNSRGGCWVTVIGFSSSFNTNYNPLTIQLRQTWLHWCSTLPHFLPALKFQSLTGMVDMKRMIAGFHFCMCLWPCLGRWAGRGAGEHFQKLKVFVWLWGNAV